MDAAELEKKKDGDFDVLTYDPEAYKNYDLPVVESDKCFLHFHRYRFQ